ncbi:hypothetical protein HCN44_005119 [Aphidius gifuensis]|uniref:Uncharacterized protein n=1 Tax=Aphidius gifuensis TaxID=684658 RepID=A0A834XSR9_APHGI|nr:uncharacterized protein LOC122852437 isoform X2 [Aphidius gifuensis]KAF7992775.1 hypothetical protein HCN44_005119 [Aphidius gifuensis]
MAKNTKINLIPQMDQENEEDLNEKQQLIDEIKQLKELISDTEYALSLKEKDNQITDNDDLNKEPNKRQYKVKNWQYIYHHELDKLAGLYCQKSINNEYVFCFDVSSSGNSDSVFAVQFFINDGKGTIGKYIMPSIDTMDLIIAETPIDQLSGIIPFLNNCKRHLDCFANRRKQYNELQKYTLNLKNIKVDADMGFNLITIYFKQVYDKDTDEFVNITVYCSYNNGSARPHMMNIDMSIEKQPTDDKLKNMKSFLKVFKKKSLYDALQDITDTTHDQFFWEPEERGTTNSIDIKTVWTSDETESEESSWSVKKSKKKTKRNKRKVPQDFDTINDSQQENNEPDDLKRTKKIKKTDTKKKQLTTKDKINNKPLRQSLLNFKTKQTESVDKKIPVVEEPMGSDDSTVKNVPITPKKLKTITSTPMPTGLDKLKKNPITMMELSPILSSKSPHKSTKNLKNPTTSVIESKNSKKSPIKTKKSPNKSKELPKKSKIAVPKKKKKF